MRNEEIVRAFDLIAADGETQARVWEQARRKRQSRGPGRKLACSLLAAAAVFCLIFFGGPLLKGENEEDLFTVTAYALSEGEDGSIRLTEADMAYGFPEYWGALIDAEKQTKIGRAHV